MVSGFLESQACARLTATSPGVGARDGGLRDPLRNWPQALSVVDALGELARSLAGTQVQAVRALLFDKTADSNWAVPWHQDLSVPLRERHEVEGYSAWSLKEGVWHASPPRIVLENMLTLRLHLDDCGEDNAPLRVLPGSHAHGKLDAARSEQLLREGEVVTCTARAGDVLVMHPLLLHASSKAARPGRRRVLHVEYAACGLPAPLAWARA